LPSNPYITSMTPIGDDLWEFTGMYPEILENIQVLKNN
jgi:hypothetical protein